VNLHNWHLLLDLFEPIFRNLTHLTIFDLNTSNLEYPTQVYPHLTHLTIRIFRENSFFPASMLRFCPNLQSLDVKCYTPVSEWIYPLLDALPHLVQLDVNNWSSLTRDDRVSEFNS